MITKRLKQSKIAKFIGLLFILSVVYAITGFLLVSFAYILPFGRAIFSTYDILVSGILFLLLFVCTYIFVFRRKKTAKRKIIQRILLYSLFFGFSAVAIFTILTPAINYTDFLRFRISGVNLNAILTQTAFYLGITCCISYTIFTALMEIQKNKNKILRQLTYWFTTTIVAGYSSLIVLFFYTGLSYQKKCVLKVDTASDYCYNIGESIYHWWQPVPGLVVFSIVMLFILVYFTKLLKTKNT